jgi:C-terminal processing protease CtpA/Prc
VTCTIHAHFKKPISDGEFVGIFFEPFDDYLASEGKKIAGITTTPRSKKMSATIKTRNLSLSLRGSNNFFDLIIAGKDMRADLRRMDMLINRGLNYVYASEQSTKTVYTEYEKTVDIKGNPMTAFVQKEAIAKFSTNVKKSFNISGLVLKFTSDPEDISVTISQRKDKTSVSVSRDTVVKNAVPLDVLLDNDKYINDLLPAVLGSLGDFPK